MSDALGADLNRLVLRCDLEARLAHDPVRFAHRYTDPADQEIAGFIASGLSYGRVSLFGPAIAILLDRADTMGGPAEWVRSFDPAREAPILASFVYRFNRGPDHIALLDGLRRVLHQHGSLGALVEMREGESDIGPALSRMVYAIRDASVRSPAGPPSWKSGSRGLRYLLPAPDEGSAAKRMAMFARWMVRTDGVDLGLWRHLHPAHLVIPLDTHVHRIARLVGLTRRASPNWRTAVDLTSALSRFDPIDPVRFDFALAHLGISGQCDGTDQVAVCPNCPLYTHCRIHRR